MIVRINLQERITPLGNKLAHLFGLARVATDFLFYPKGKVKKHRKDLWDVFLGSGGRWWKGKLLAPFSSMVIHGLLVTCFRSLALIFDCLKLWCMCVFWKCFFEIDAFVSATIVMTRVWVYTTVCIFSKKMFQNVFGEFVLKVFVRCGFWKGGKCFCKLISSN